MKEKTIDISLKSMIRECSINPNMAFDIYNDIGFINRENIHSIFKYKKFNDDFISNLSVYCNETQFTGSIKPSYDYYINRLLQLLNVDIDITKITEDELTTILLKRIELLRTIRKENELRYNFPLLYKDLIDGRNYFNSLQKVKNYNQQQYKDGEHYYYSCALKKNLKKFVETQSEMYTRYIKKRNLLKEKYENTSFNEQIRKYFDFNKLALFIVYNYLVVCESSNDKLEIKQYLKKINLYLNNPTIDKNVIIYSDDNKEININTIRKGVEEILYRLNSDNRKVDWILIPKGRELRTLKKKNNTVTRTTIMNYKEIEKLQTIGKEKNLFYESTNYIARVVGLGKYKGYVGYIYPNGNVILDMEYDENRPYTAKGNAIYIMSVCDFEELSKLSKQLLRNDPRVKRYCHVGKWQNIINDIVEKEASESDIYNSNLLIKRLKRKASY